MISAEETAKINELRSMVRSDLLTKDRYGDDHYLIRWLRARNMDVEKASEMLEKSMKWRQENGADDVIASGADIPIKYRKIYPIGMFGRDQEDCVVVFFPLGRFHHRILMENEGIEKALRYNMIWMEKLTGILKKCEEETGKKGLKIVEIVDMEWYSYKELSYGPGRDYMVQTNKVFDDNYPELLKSCIIINAPKIFTLLWNMIKPFLSKATMAKVQIYGGPGGTDEENWKEMLRAKLDADRVPKRWGGTREGTDEFCSKDSDVWLDAPVPLKFFTEGEVIFDGLKTEKVKARDKLVVEVPVDVKTLKFSAENSVKLYWKFKVESHDICFSIVFKPDNRKDAQIIHSECRVDSKQGLQEGVHEIPGDSISGIYNVIFDNRYSYTRSKTVHYSAKVEQAIENSVTTEANEEDNSSIESTPLKDNQHHDMTKIE